MENAGIPTTTKTKTCAICDCTSTYVDAFQLVVDDWHCHGCIVDEHFARQEKNYKLWNWLSVGAVFLGTILYFAELPYTFLLFNFALLRLMWVIPPLIFLLSHVIASKIIGSHIWLLRYGYGKIIWEKIYTNRRLQLGKSLNSSYIVETFPQLKWIRTKHFLSLSAPIIIFGFIVFFLWLNLDFDHIQSQVAFVEIFFVACFYFLILLAYPTQGTAGYEISELLKGNTTAEDIHKVHYNVASYQLTALKRIHDAEEMAEKGYRKYPTDPIILQTYATKLMDVNKLATAFAIIDKIERVSEPDPYKEALLYNNVAWSYLKGNDVQKARDWSEKAMAIVPWAVPFKGTWGAVLVESGDFEEGMKVIREVIAKEIERSHLATLNAHLAIGYARMGQTQLAKTALQDALNYDKDAEFVSKAVAEVDSAKTN